MSRVGKIPVTIPEGVKPSYENNILKVSGKLGELSLQPSENVTVKIDGSDVIVTPNSDSNQSRAHWGLTRSLIANMVQGVSEGFSITLEIQGVGYRAAVAGKILTLFLGYSHEIKYFIPEGIDIKCEKPTLLVVTGVDKQKVGQVAALIMKQRPVEPYKGKGIFKQGSFVRRKVRKK